LTYLGFSPLEDPVAFVLLEGIEYLCVELRLGVAEHPARREACGK
jgi:hypothetical protein